MKNFILNNKKSKILLIVNEKLFKFYVIPYIRFRKFFLIKIKNLVEEFCAFLLFNLCYEFKWCEEFKSKSPKSIKKTS